MKKDFGVTDVDSITKIIKRDGRSEAFKFQKVVDVIKLARIATEEFDIKKAESLAIEVLKILENKFVNSDPHVEEIQDIIEKVLISSGYLDTAREYIVYREQHSALRKDKENLVDVVKSINEYLNREDWRVNANANQGYSLGGMILNISGKMVANYWLNKVYPEYIGNAHRDGDFHIHDLDMLAGYCAGWSLKMLLAEGLNGIPDKIESSPPKHLSSALGQMVNFLGSLQNEWAGAQAFSSFDTYLAPYVRIDNLRYDEVKQQIQQFIYNLNVPSRWGTQTPFTNLTFDIACPEDLKDVVPFIYNKTVDFKYGDLVDEMHMINKAYIECMLEGDSKGRVFTFPIPTYNITDDFPWESENAKLLFELTAKYGLPYFQNFVNSDLNPAMVRSMCCRLQLDLRELLKRGNSLFGSAEQTGSIGVVTINCARLGYLCKGDEESLFHRLDVLMEYSKISLEIKRKLIQRLMDAGLYPFTKRYLGTLRNHFSTIGVNGIHEMILNFSDNKYGITSKEGRILAIRLLDRMRDRLLQFQEETGNMYNLEATPAEGATYRFAREDAKRFKGIIQSGTPEAPYYTNSSQLPVDFTSDAFEALMHQDELQRKYTGGTVLHLYMNERISDGNVCGKLIKKIVENFRLPYFTITPTFSVCPIHGYIPGAHEFCPKCDSILESSLKAKQKIA